MIFQRTKCCAVRVSVCGIALFLCAEFVCAGSTSADFETETAAKKAIAAREHSMLVESLRDALERRDAFFRDADALDENERARRALDVAERFELVVSKFPNAVPALFFFAEFLYQGGENARAENLLSRAEKIDPDFAPASFLLAEIFAKNGDAEAAFPRFSAAVKSDPGEAFYHFAFGEFLAKFRERLLAQKTVVSRADFDALLQNEFRAACAAAPFEAGFRLRYAESFYDVETPDWQRALAAWDAVLRGLGDSAETNLRARAELCRADALAHLGRFDEAESLLEKNAGIVPALERSRRKIFNFIQTKKQ